MNIWVKNKVSVFFPSVFGFLFLLSFLLSLLQQYYIIRLIAFLFNALSIDFIVKISSIRSDLNVNLFS